MAKSPSGGGGGAGRANPYGSPQTGYGGQQPIRSMPVAKPGGMIDSFGQLNANMNYLRMQNDMRSGNMGAPRAPMPATPAAPVAPRPPPQMGTVASATKGAAPVSYFKNAADIAPGAIGNIRPNAGAIGVNRVRGVAPPPPPPAPVQQPRTVYYPWRPTSYMNYGSSGGGTAGDRRGSSGYGGSASGGPGGFGGSSARGGRAY